MDFIDQNDIAVFVSAEFVFGVHENDALFGCDFLSTGEQFERDAGQMVPFVAGNHSPFEQNVGSYGFVVIAVCGFGGGR